MATAKKLPSGNWRVLQYEGKAPDGTRLYGSYTAGNKKEAEFEAALANLKRRKQKPPSLLFGDAVDRCIASKSGVLSPATLREYKAMRRIGYHGIENIDLNELTHEQIQSAVNDYSKGRSAKTVRNMYSLLTSTLAMFQPERKVRVLLPQRKKTRLVVPDSDTVRMLLERSKDKPLYTAILFASALGLRRSEICALEWADINFRTSRININKAVVMDEHRAWVTKGTKSESSTRLLDAPPFLMSHLKTLSQTDNRIIPMNPDALTDAFTDLRERCGFDGRFHDLRHYYASLLLALGVPDKYAMQRMGHATPTMLKQVYQHLMDDKEQELNIEINNKLTEIFK